MNDIEYLKEEIEHLKYEKATYSQEMNMIYKDVLRGMFRGEKEYENLEKRYKHLGNLINDIDKEILKRLKK